MIINLFIMKYKKLIIFNSEDVYLLLYIVINILDKIDVYKCLGTKLIKNRKMK